MRVTTLVSAAAFFELSIAGYVLEDDYMTDFYSNFNFFTDKDPTQGRYMSPLGILHLTGDRLCQVHR
jgi:hypothetical protein